MMANRHPVLNLSNMLNMRDELRIMVNVPFKGKTMLVPLNVKLQVIESICAVKKGLTGALLNGRGNLFLPQLKATIHDLPLQSQRQSNEESSTESPIIDRKPEYPFQQVSADLCYVDGQALLLYVDRNSGWVGAERPTISAFQTIRRSFWKIFNRFGIPEEISADWESPISHFDYDKFWEVWNANGKLRRDNKNGSSMLFGQSSLDLVHLLEQKLQSQPSSTTQSHDNNPLPRHVTQNTTSSNKPLVLSVGDHVQIQNQYGGGHHSTTTYSTGVVTEVMPLKQYRVKKDGSRQMMLLHGRVLKKISSPLFVQTTSPMVEPIITNVKPKADHSLESTLMVEPVEPQPTPQPRVNKAFEPKSKGRETTSIYTQTNSINMQEAQSMESTGPIGDIPQLSSFEKSRSNSGSGVRRSTRARRQSVPFAANMSGKYHDTPVDTQTNPINIQEAQSVESTDPFDDIPPLATFEKSRSNSGSGMRQSTRARRQSVPFTANMSGMYHDTQTNPINIPEPQSTESTDPFDDIPPLANFEKPRSNSGSGVRQSTRARRQSVPFAANLSGKYHE